MRGPVPEGYVYNCIEDFVLRRGRLFPPQAMSREEERDIRSRHLGVVFEPRQCFYNAQLAAIRDRRLTYVEGYVLRIIPILHAWLVTDSGAVVDPTPAFGIWNGWFTDLEYFGVEFRDTGMLARRMVESGYSSSLLDDWQADWPAMRGVYDKEVVPVRGHADNEHDRGRRKRKGGKAYCK
jgi:hypothetical protein